MAAVERR
ncbi:hypothetical protein NXF25_010381 [Crotalus adamanteus]